MRRKWCGRRRLHPAEPSRADPSRVAESISQREQILFECDVQLTRASLYNKLIWFSSACKAVRGGGGGSRRGAQRRGAHRIWSLVLCETCTAAQSECERNEKHTSYFHGVEDEVVGYEESCRACGNSALRTLTFYSYAEINVFS